MKRTISVSDECDKEIECLRHCMPMFNLSKLVAKAVKEEYDKLSNTSEKKRIEGNKLLKEAEEQDKYINSLKAINCLP